MATLLDFLAVRTIKTAKDKKAVKFEFRYGQPRDVCIRGSEAVAMWDPYSQQWLTEMHLWVAMLDKILLEHTEEIEARNEDIAVTPLLPSLSSTKFMEDFKKYLDASSDSPFEMDPKPTFKNTQVTKESHVTKRLPYSLEDGDHSAWDTLVSTLYDPAEVEKIEWMIGSIVSGDSTHIQKFYAFYGAPGAGKSTIINVVNTLFEGYSSPIDINGLVGTGTFKGAELLANPLIAFHHDADLSHAQDNSFLNSVVSHETMSVQVKYSRPATIRCQSTLILATNTPVRITGANSGLTRRLIDIPVNAEGRRLPREKYDELMHEIPRTLGAIAYHCLQRYKRMGSTAYDGYLPTDMASRTDHILNFILECEDEIGCDVTLTRLYDVYKHWCESSGINYPFDRMRFRLACEPYWLHFVRDTTEDGKRIKNTFRGYIGPKHSVTTSQENEDTEWLDLVEQDSYLDTFLLDCPAQYANEDGHPARRWDDVDTILSDISTTREHYVRPPQDMLVIDFDLKDESGNKSRALNLKAASQWPPTYAEFSRGGEGVHLHYMYDGDTSQLATHYADDIEVKVYRGKSALRRRLSACNSEPVREFPTDLPLPQKERRNVDSTRVTNEMHIRRLIAKCLRKENHGATKPEIDFIEHILEEAYAGDISYDVTNMRPAIQRFAMSSTHQSAACMAAVRRMHFHSRDLEDVPPDEGYEEAEMVDDRNGSIVFFDVEVYPNYFLVCYKSPSEKVVHPMANPSKAWLDTFLHNYRLIGFNNRKYDNHILYGAYMGLDNRRLYDLSRRIVSGDRTAFYKEAYNLSYTDIYDYSSKKQSLKKWEIELGITHIESDIPWDQPVEDSQKPRIEEYCKNDVLATQAVWEATQTDFEAREVLAGVAGMSVNTTTNTLTQHILFGKERHPQKDFVYTDLSEMFPGYKYEFGKSTYRGEEVGEGGYVYSEPGYYENVGLLDIASMHPTSIEQLNLFGPYTKNFSDIKQARLAVKHKDVEAASKLLDGRLKPYLEGASDEDLKKLAQALKLAINSVYGLTAAKFENRCRDPRNVDNIVAKRGALFMVDLKHFLQEQGIQVVHIKTDSVKIPNITQEIVDLVSEFGKRYGYIFEWEATYDRICLVNKSTYIAHDEYGWHATGAQFQHPVVFKTLFSHEEITLEDYSETKSVVHPASLALDRNEDDPTESHHYDFVGRCGSFVPVKPGVHGGILVRRNGDGKYTSVTGTLKKGTKDPYRWVPAEQFKRELSVEQVDTSYSDELVEAARLKINSYVPFDQFITL